MGSNYMGSLKLANTLSRRQVLVDQQDSAVSYIELGGEGGYAKVDTRDVPLLRKYAWRSTSRQMGRGSYYVSGNVPGPKNWGWRVCSMGHFLAEAWGIDPKLCRGGGEGGMDFRREVVLDRLAPLPVR